LSHLSSIKALTMSYLAHNPNWRSHLFRAMGTEMAFWLETADITAAKNAFAEAEALFRHHEQVLSRFQAQSELSRLNRRTGRWTAVSSLFWDILVQALAMSEQTGGRFDPTILNGLEQAGYARSFELLSTSVPIPEAPSYPVMAGNWGDVLLDHASQSVYLPVGLRLDLGGIAKGYTAQQAVTLLGQVGPCLVDAGGDICAGAAPSDTAGWPVAVTSPRTSTKQIDLFTLFLANASLATSGIDHRRWQQNGRSQHHILDPAAGQPVATDLLTATVWAETAVEAEAWATASIIYGAASGTAALIRQGIPAALITQNQDLLITPAMARFVGLVAAPSFPQRKAKNVVVL